MDGSDKLQGQQNLAEILDMEEILMDGARLRQWQEDCKGVLHIEDDDSVEKILKAYEINHAFLTKYELTYNLKLLKEIIKYL